MQPLKKQKGVAQSSAPEDTMHTLGILSSLFTNLPSDSPARIRLLAKFVENNYEKTDKLLDIHTSAQTRLTVMDGEIDAEKEALLKAGEGIGGSEEDAWYIRRLDGGLYTLQTVDYILAWTLMEDDGVGVIQSLGCPFLIGTPDSRACAADVEPAEQVVFGHCLDVADFR
jgi:beta-catenin-like protein 1